MDKIKIKINGKEIITNTGNTILQVINENKLDKIPTLCYDSRIHPYGSCFLCVVEVKGMSRLVPSCCTKIHDNMEIVTENERIQSSRKTALELLLSNHYADCIGPCVNNCPAHVDAQSYIALISMGKYEEALKLIKKQNPLPLSIGRVCVRDCEVTCRRQIIDESLGINHLKRYVADIDAQHQWVPQIKNSKNKKVAIVGGGPSGLTCAYYLRLEGYSVTIFEKFSKLGGMLMYGIPEYRLPKKILEDEINWIINLGFEVKTNVEMGKDFSVETLLKDGFDSIFIAVGAHKASTMRLENEDDTEGVLWGIDFLRQLPDSVPELKGTVIIVGGGNTAIDAARTSLRCGADQVKIVYRRSVKEMPAHHEEIEAAQKEGVEILFLTNPKSIIRDKNKRLKGIECLEMKLMEAKPGERPRPVPVEGSEFELSCDYLIGAIGQQIDTTFNGHGDGCQLNRWDNIVVDTETQETSIEGVFAGGDVVSGPYTAISAIAHGKIAAQSIDEYLTKGQAKKKRKPFLSFKHTFSEISQYELSHFKKLPREKMPALPVKERVNDFREVESGYTEEQANCEPERCLECGCSEYSDCKLRLLADDFGVDVAKFLGETRKYTVDTRHPFITLDPNKCVNCGLCVRTCSEILKISALGFINRGFRAVVKPAMEKPLLETNCITCGNCLDVCPTGAITENFPFKVLGSLHKENRETVCNFCSVGCKVNFKVINDDIFFVNNSTDGVKNSINKGYLCVKGRFGHRYLMEKTRIKTPVIKQDQQRVQVDLAKAVKYTSSKLKEIAKKYGPESIAILGSPKLSNEELYLLQKLARTGVKTNNITSFTHMLHESDLNSLDTSIGITTSTASLNDISQADVIIVINGNLSEENVIMEKTVREAQKNGAKLVLVNSSEVKLTKFADLWVDTRKGSNTALMNGIMRELIAKDLIGSAPKVTEGFTELKKMVSNFTPENVLQQTGIDPERYQHIIDWTCRLKQNIIFIYNIDSQREKSQNDLKAIGNFLLLTGRIIKKNNGLIIFREHVNSTGVMEMGVSLHYLPGFVKPFEIKEIERIGKYWDIDLKPIFRPVDLKTKFLTGKIKALLVFGEDPLSVSDNNKYFKGVEFMMIQDFLFTNTAEEADVILPAATYIEQEGSFTTCDHKIQRVQAIKKTINGVDENWRVIEKLLKEFKPDTSYNSLSDVVKEISIINRYYGKQLFGDNGTRNPLRIGYFNETGKPKFSLYPKDEITFRSEDNTLLYPENFYITKIKNRLVK